jgi:hypothetical protein
MPLASMVMNDPGPVQGAFARGCAPSLHNGVRRSFRHLDPQLLGSADEQQVRHSHGLLDRIGAEWKVLDAHGSASARRDMGHSAIGGSDVELCA